MENELKQMMIKTLEAEQRTNLFKSMIRLGLLTCEVKAVLRNQRGLRKKGGLRSISKIGLIMMKEKLTDSMKQTDKLRKGRLSLKVKLREMLNDMKKYGKITYKLKKKMEWLKASIQKKNKENLNVYKGRKDTDDLEIIANLRVDMKEFGNL